MAMKSSTVSLVAMTLLTSLTAATANASWSYSQLWCIENQAATCC